ncbi:MAG: LPS export ABC transporter periplasmic protein LptC [Muribaculaceae bacterium]|nr:LPS export ABC transporter periplasmic protein LptC [Muribaculaceae bacterium]
MRKLPFILCCLVLALIGCREESRPGQTSNMDLEVTPTMITNNVETLISDSGVTRYKIVSPIWLMYEEATVPRWRFPKSLHLERYDDFMRIESTVDCDSATYFTKDQIWRLDGNVRIISTLGEKFLTNQLFWNQRQHKVYSDSFIHIEKPDRTLEGYGFTANERMTEYKIKRVSGIFPAELKDKDKMSAQPGSYPSPNPSITPNPSTPPPPPSQPTQPQP